MSSAVNPALIAGVVVAFVVVVLITVVVVVVVLKRRRHHHSNRFDFQVYEANESLTVIY